MDIRDILPLAPGTILETIPEGERESVLTHCACTVRHYRNRTIVHFQGDACDVLDIVLSGMLSVERVDEEGNNLAVARFSRGAIVGGHLVFASNHTYPNTITSVVDSTVLGIATESLFSLLQDYPDFLRWFLRAVSDNALVVSERLSDVAHRTLRQRLGTYLIAESERQGSRTITLPVSKTRLASMLGVSRTSVSRELRRMQCEELLHYVNKTVVLFEKMGNAP